MNDFRTRVLGSVRSGECFTIYRIWGKRGGRAVRMGREMQCSGMHHSDAVRPGIRLHLEGLVESPGGYFSSLRLMVEDCEARTLRSASGAATWGQDRIIIGVFSSRCDAGNYPTEASEG
jgi:hypothetical protein